MNSLLYLNAILLCQSLHPRRIFQLMNSFNGNAKQVWEAQESELVKNAFPDKIIKKFIAERKQVDPISEWETLVKSGVSLLPHPSIFDQKTQDAESSLTIAKYPDLLKHVADAPPLLYLKGKTDINFPHILAVVGSRKCTNYGKQVVNDIVYSLALNDIVIISGFAFGIDILAHHASLKAKKPTIAVLAHGLDTIYPATNTNSVQKILEHNGALVSEFPIGISPTKYSFPRRNRIISGLAHSTLVIEAAKKSGSLITAYHALEQNRDVFAIPGSIYSATSQGTNNLIQRGAKLIQSAEDILEEFGLQNSPQYDIKAERDLFFSPLEKTIFEILEEPRAVDEIIVQTKDATPQQVNAALTRMELNGMVQCYGGQYCRKNR